jgi:hypothetical protein
MENKIYPETFTALILSNITIKLSTNFWGYNSGNSWLLFRGGGGYIDHIFSVETCCLLPICFVLNPED